MTRIIPLRLPISYAYLICDLGAILVDTGQPGDGMRIRKLLAKEGVALEDLTMILHTHGHWDHCGSTRELGLWTAAPRAIHQADAEMMRHGHNGELKPTSWVSRLLKPLLDRPFPGVEPNILLEGETDLSSFGVSACVIPTPGHSAGSISVLTANGEAIVGDLLMGGFLEFWPHRPMWHYFAEDQALVRTSIGKLLDLGTVRIYPGHGGPLDPVEVARRFGRRLRRSARREVSGR